MRPEQRLDQIGPVLAEVPQKVDRLIDGQSRILNEVAKIGGIETKIAGIEAEVAKIAGIEIKVDGIETKVAGLEINTATRARAVASLTVDFGEFKEEVRTGFGKLERLRVSQEKMQSTQQEILALLQERS